MVGNNDRIAGAEGESQILPGLPGVLRERLPHVGPKDGVRAMADFRIRVEQAQSSVRDRDPRPARPSVNRNWPFWLLVQVGQACTFISSLSFSPERSQRAPNFSV